MSTVRYWVLTEAGSVYRQNKVVEHKASARPLDLALS